MLYTHCQRCGKKLKTKESKAIGMGPVCFSHWSEERKRDYGFHLFDEMESPVSDSPPASIIQTEARNERGFL